MKLLFPRRMIVCASMILVGCEGSTERSRQQTIVPAAGVPIQKTMDLGVLVQGESTQFRQWIRNESEHQVEVTNIEKSCDCIDVKIAESRIASRDKTLVVVTYDSSKEPDFTGGLVIEVSLWDAKRTQVGKISVPVEVIGREVAN